MNKMNIGGMIASWAFRFTQVNIKQKALFFRFAQRSFDFIPCRLGFPLPGQKTFGVSGLASSLCLRSVVCYPPQHVASLLSRLDGFRAGHDHRLESLSWHMTEKSTVYSSEKAQRFFCRRRAFVFLSLFHNKVVKMAIVQVLSIIAR